MGTINIELTTDKENEISIDINTNCSLDELGIATSRLMVLLALHSENGIKVLESLLNDIKEANYEELI